MDLKLKLLGLMRAEFEEAKFDQIRVLLLQVIVTACSGIAVFVPGTSLTYPSSVLAVVGALAWNFVSTKGSRRKSTAERARRALLLMYGLGRDISGKELRDIMSAFSISEAKAQNWEDPDYYDAMQPPGAGKLASMLQQSAFWSKELYKLSAQRAWLQVSISLLVSLLSLLFLPLLPNAKFTIQLAQIICVGLTLFVTRDLIGKALSFGEASNRLNEIEQKLENLVGPGASESDVLFLLGECNSVIDCTPLISSGLYNKNKVRLETLWTIRASTQSVPVAPTP